MGPGRGVETPGLCRVPVRAGGYGRTLRVGSRPRRAAREAGAFRPRPRIPFRAGFRGRRSIGRQGRSGGGSCGPARPKRRRFMRPGKAEAAEVHAARRFNPCPATIHSGAPPPEPACARCKPGTAHEGRRPRRPPPRGIGTYTGGAQENPRVSGPAGSRCKGPESPPLPGSSARTPRPTVEDEAGAPSLVALPTETIVTQKCEAL